MLLVSNGNNYLLEWDNTTVWDFKDSCYDHVEIAGSSLKRIADCGRDLGPCQSFEDRGFILFLEKNEDYQELASDLIDNDFPNYYRPFPGKAIYDLYIEWQTQLGQAALETWLEQSD